MLHTLCFYSSPAVDDFFFMKSLKYYLVRESAGKDIHAMESVVVLCFRQLARETKGHTAEESNYSGCQWPSLWKLGGAFVSTLRLSSEEHSSPKSALQSKTCRRSQSTIALRMSKRGRHLVVQLWQCKYIFCCCARNRKWITGQVKISPRIWDVCVSTGLYFRGKVIDKA